MSESSDVVPAGSSPLSISSDRGRKSSGATPVNWQQGDTILGLYRVLRVLGQGGMGTVYLVHHLGWDVKLAVKCPRPYVVKNGVEAFERECETWVNLAYHPHVVRCYYVRRILGIPCVFAEFIAGGTLHHWIETRHLYRGGPRHALERMLAAAIHCAEALDFAHSRGLIHQDIKTNNILMTPNNVAKVTDFGIAKALVLAASGAEQAEVGGRGTPLFRSPEQENDEPLTRQTDMWSWAAVVLQMFIGDITWMTGPGVAGALDGYLELGPDDVSIPAMPDPLVELLRSCFQREPEKRPATMTEIISQLREIYLESNGAEFPRTEVIEQEDSPDQLNNKAVSLLDLGKREEAEKYWEQALSAHPDHPEGTYNVLLSRWRVGEATDMVCLRALRAMQRKHPDDWLPAYLIALIHMERGDVLSAITIGKSILEKKPDLPVVAGFLESAMRREQGARRLTASFGERSASPISTICISWDGAVALSGGGTEAGGTLHFWDVKAGTCLRTLEGHEASVTSSSLSPDGYHALTGGKDATVRLWHVQSGQCQAVLGRNESPVNAVALTADRKNAVTGGGDGRLRIWNVGSREQVAAVRAHDGPLNAFWISSSGRIAVTGGDDGRVRLWDLSGGKCARTLEGHTSPVTAIGVSDDRRFILSGSNQGRLRVWDSETGQCRAAIHAHSSQLVTVWMSPNNLFALTGSSSERLRLWELRHGRCLHTFAGQGPFSVAGDSRELLSASPEGSLQLWQLGAYGGFRAPMMLCRTHD